MEDIAEQLRTLNANFERFLVVAEKIVEQKSSKSTPKRGPNKMDDNTATIDTYKNSIIIKCPPNQEFRNKLKEHGGSWNPSLRSWVFGKNNGDLVWNEIINEFKDWTLNDKREKSDTE